MPKTKAYPIFPEEARQHKEDVDTQPEPLSGSKKVKNHNHSRQNHGEGS